MISAITKNHVIPGPTIANTLVKMHNSWQHKPEKILEHDDSSHAISQVAYQVKQASHCLK